MVQINIFDRGDAVKWNAGVIEDVVDIEYGDMDFIDKNVINMSDLAIYVDRGNVVDINDKCVGKVLKWRYDYYRPEMLDFLAKIKDGLGIDVLYTHTYMQL